ncbi:hypothetical protein MA16_Dca023498 [Dendrobium catenatum]|uniref:Uncharacterized protein n=1 Tax=Dendrobium catenatum TaxID=906689 RepID=A0A2I0WQI4_9ASPA|nr:hypothetical protein MA16_Dca023498 [Dendrobium catenatum]
MEQRRQAVVQRKSGPHVVAWWSTGRQAVVQWKFRPQVVIRQNPGLRWRFDRSSGPRWWPAEIRASSGGLAEQRRQVVVPDRGEGHKWWSGGTTMSGGGPAEV